MEGRDENMEGRDENMERFEENVKKLRSAHAAGLTEVLVRMLQFVKYGGRD